MCHAIPLSKVKQNRSGSNYRSLRSYHKFQGQWRLSFLACPTVRVEIQSHIPFQQQTKANAKPLIRTRNETMQQFATSIGFFLCSGVVGMADQHVLKFNSSGIMSEIFRIMLNESMRITIKSSNQFTRFHGCHGSVCSLHGFIKPEFKSMSPQSGRPRR